MEPGTALNDARPAARSLGTISQSYLTTMEHSDDDLHCSVSYSSDYETMKKDLDLPKPMDDANSAASPWKTIPQTYLTPKEDSDDDLPCEVTVSSDYEAIEEDVDLHKSMDLAPVDAKGDTEDCSESEVQ